MRRLSSILLLVLPLAAFALSLCRVSDLFDQGEVLNGILFLLGGLALLVAIELPLLRYHFLPRWGQAIGERIYGGSYSPAEDKIVALAEEIRRSGDAARLPDLEALVRADRTRLRGWRELADVQMNVFHRADDAIATLLEAENSVSDKEDRALLLYRAAQWAENRSANPARARELFALAAEKYPSTVYGQRAVEREDG